VLGREKPCVVDRANTHLRYNGQKTSEPARAQADCDQSETKALTQRFPFAVMEQHWRYSLP